MKLWLSCNRFTVQVNVEKGVIVWGAPLVDRKIGGYQEAKL